MSRLGRNTPLLTLPREVHLASKREQQPLAMRQAMTTLIVATAISVAAGVVFLAADK
jgi:hypothetical protein